MESKRFRARSKRRCCLVVDQNLRLSQEIPRNGKALTLASGKLAAAGPDSLPETIGQARNKRGESDAPNDFPQFLVGRRRPHKAKVGDEGSIEQNRIARQITDVPAQTLQLNVPDVFASKPDRTTNWVVEPG